MEKGYDVIGFTRLAFKGHLDQGKKHKGRTIVLEKV